MKGILNHKNDSYIWYHTTPQERVDSILKDGLKINSPPTYQGGPEPWIYVSTEPFWMENGVTLKVDLEDVKHKDAGWPFQSGPEEDPEEWEARWQLRVFVDVPTEKLKIDGSSEYL